MQYFQSSEQDEVCSLLSLSVCLLCLCSHPCNIFSPVSRMKSAVFCLYLSVFFACVPIHAIFQFSEQDEVCSLLSLSVCLLCLCSHPYNIISPVSWMKLQCLHWSPELHVGIHWTGPCLAPQGIDGGTGLKDVFGALRTCTTWMFVCVRDFQAVEAGEELTVSCSQSEDDDLNCSV